MTENQPDNNVASRERARAQADAIVPADRGPNYRQVLRVWERPSFAPSASWLLIEHEPSGRLFVRTIDEYATRQVTLFADPFQGAPVVAAPREEIEPILGDLNRAPLPLTGIEVVIGLDGCVYGIETLDPFARATIEWWEDGPKEWRAFTRAVARLREALRRLTQEDAG